jgi:hypothetical protein
VNFGPEKNASNSYVSSNLALARESKDDAVCENCTAIDGDPSCRGQHRSNAETSMVLCSGCEEYQCPHGKMRDPIRQRRLELVYKIDQLRERGEPVLCCFCEEPEAQGKKCRISDQAIGPFCSSRNCRREAGDDSDDTVDIAVRPRLAKTQRSLKTHR